MSKTVDTRYTQERELSWLRFNERVLEEARDETVPLFERLKFAAIFTSNLDEFFMIRVGSIYDMTLSRQDYVDSRSGLTPAEQIQAICKAVPALYKQRDKIVSQLEKRLRACNICALKPDELDGKERKQAERWFRDYVQPVLSPMAPLRRSSVRLVRRTKSSNSPSWGSSPSTGKLCRRPGPAPRPSWCASFCKGRRDRKSTRLNSSHSAKSRMPSSA